MGAESRRLLELSASKLERVEMRSGEPRLAARALWIRAKNGMDELRVIFVG